VKVRVFFICSTVIEVDESVANGMVKEGSGRFREAAAIMDESLFGSGVSVLAYPAYEEWKEDHPGIEHRVVGDFNVMNKVEAKLSHPKYRN